MSTVVLLPLSVVTPAPELPAPEGPEAPLFVQEVQVDDSNVYHSDDSDDSELDPTELEAQAKLKAENEAYRRGIVRNLTEATQLAIETETLELQIQQLERDLARDEDLYHRFKKSRSKRPVRRKRLTKPTTGPSLPPKGPRRRFHRKGT